jgi:hypothetical protein
VLEVCRVPALRMAPISAILTRSPFHLGRGLVMNRADDQRGGRFDVYGWGRFGLSRCAGTQIPGQLGRRPLTAG